VGLAVHGLPVVRRSAPSGVSASSASAVVSVSCRPSSTSCRRV